MECTACGGLLSDEMVEHGRVERIGEARCFSCYLDSRMTAFDYAEYLETVSGENEQTIESALSQTVSYWMGFDILGWENEGLVVFAPTREDVDALQETIMTSVLGESLSTPDIVHLADLYEQGHHSLCWQAANWRYDPYGRSSRPGPASISVVNGIPCIVDAFNYYSDAAEADLLDDLLAQFQQSVDIADLDSLRDVREAASRSLPVATQIHRRVVERIKDYFRRNPDLLSTSFKELPPKDAETAGDRPHHTPQPSTSPAELEQLYNTAVSKHGTKEQQIKELLTAAEGAPAKHIADVIDCSPGYVRRYRYDADTGAAVEKDWSKADQAEKVSPGTRDRILRRDCTCLRCGTDTALTIHHITPVSDGGRTTDDNLATLCEDCHQAAHDGSFYPPTTVYDTRAEFSDWIEE